MAKKPPLQCEVSSDGVRCSQPAAFFLVIGKGSRLYQGQEPSPRCQVHAEQAVQALTDALSTHELIPIKHDGGGDTE